MKNSLAGFRGNQVFNSVALLALGIALWLATSSGAVAQPGTVTISVNGQTPQTAVVCPYTTCTITANITSVDGCPWVGQGDYYLASGGSMIPPDAFADADYSSWALCYGWEGYQGIDYNLTDNFTTSGPGYYAFQTSVPLQACGYYLTVTQFYILSIQLEDVGVIDAPAGLPGGEVAYDPPTWAYLKSSNSGDVIEAQADFYPNTDPGSGVSWSGGNQIEWNEAVVDATTPSLTPFSVSYCSTCCDAALYVVWATITSESFPNSYSGLIDNDADWTHSGTAVPSTQWTYPGPAYPISYAMNTAEQTAVVLTVEPQGVPFELDGDGGYEGVFYSPNNSSTGGSQTVTSTSVENLPNCVGILEDTIDWNIYMFGSTLHQDLGGPNPITNYVTVGTPISSYSRWQDTNPDISDEDIVTQPNVVTVKRLAWACTSAADAASISQAVDEIQDALQGHTGSTHYGDPWYCMYAGIEGTEGDPECWSLANVAAAGLNMIGISASAPSPAFPTTDGTAFPGSAGVSSTTCLNPELPTYTNNGSEYPLILLYSGTNRYEGFFTVSNLGQAFTVWPQKGPFSQPDYRLQVLYAVTEGDRSEYWAFDNATSFTLGGVKYNPLDPVSGSFVGAPYDTSLTVPTP